MNAQMRFYQNNQTQAAAYSKYISMICETMPITPENKKVGLEINADGETVQQLILYKQIVKSI
jgi:spore germination protein GerM